MKKDARSVGTEAQQEKRRIAVQAVIDGFTHQAAADLVHVTRQSVTEWVKLYRNGGFKALVIKRGRPKGKKLKPYQIANICKAIKDKCPDQMKLFGALWTADAVRLLIIRRCNVRYSVGHVQCLLKQWGYTPQKPIRRAYEQNPDAVNKWINEEYPKIKRQAKREKALIYWADETGARSDYNTGRSYSKRGNTPVIYDTGQRFGCNVITALTNRGHLNFMVYKGRFNTGVFLDFLRRLIRHGKRKVYIIVDGHPAHRSKKVRAWIEKNKQKIELYFLPSYSPELNPDEYLNNDIKQNAVGKRRAKKQDELVSNIRSHLYSRQKNPKLVARFFHHKDVIYAS